MNAIEVRNVSKRYRIGLVESDHRTFAGQLVDMVKAPFNNLRKLRSLSRFEQEDESVFWALRDISFDVKEGEVLGIIGHNGAGKSTLLKILSRITEPTTGEITIRGRVSSLLEVGTGFHPDLTGRENIYMNGTILGMKKKEIDARFDEIVAFSGVEKYIDTPVKRYSSGMKVRLAFSVAAHLEPEVLIIDEVLAVGDAEFQAKCLGKMEDIAGYGRTILFVSHNMIAMQNLCNRALILNHGILDSEVGETNQIIRKYLGQKRDSIINGVIPDSFPRPWGSINVRFLKTYLRNHSGDLLNDFFYKEKLVVEITLDVDHDVTNAYLVLILTDDSGARILSSNSFEDTSHSLLNLNKGLATITVELTPNIVPGDYYISLRLIDFRKNKVYDAVDEVTKFTVLSNNNFKNQWFPFKRGAAPVVSICNWRLEQNATNV